MTNIKDVQRLKRGRSSPISRRLPKIFCWVVPGNNPSVLHPSEWGMKEKNGGMDWERLKRIRESKDRQLKGKWKYHMLGSKVLPLDSIVPSSVSSSSRRYTRPPPFPPLPPEFGSSPWAEPPPPPPPPP